MDRYLDFDLLFRKTDTGYRAQVLTSPAGQAAADFTAPFTELELENLLLRIGRPRRSTRRIGSAEMTAVKAFGGKLFSAVFGADVLACFRMSQQQASEQEAGLRIRLRLSEVPELADLPWEYLYNAPLNRFLGLSAETPIVRYLDLAERIQPLRVELPLRILVMVSSPHDYPTLEVEAEWSQLKEALADLETQGRVIVERLSAATLPALQRRLRLRDDPCHVFHFIGHGGFSEQSADGTLVFEDKTGRGDPVSSEYLGTILHDHRPLRIAVLNACEGARGGRKDPFAGTAQSLIQQGIPAVIAMQFEITDESALTFAHELYLAIADGCSIDTALAEARKALYSQAEDVEWGTPVLYMRTSDGQIFDVTKGLPAKPVTVDPPPIAPPPQTAAPPQAPGPSLETRPPRVYISYSWESQEHLERVLELSNTLRGDGVDSHIDQYEIGPPNWRQWQDEQIRAADFVLMVCTEEYKRRLETEPGRGVYVDGELIQARLAANANRSWLVVAGFGSYWNNRPTIPAFLNDVGYYDVGDQAGYERLLARLFGQPLVVAPPVGQRRPRSMSRPAAPQRVTPEAPSIADKAAQKIETKRSSVYICYSHEDREWLDRLRTHLNVLRLEYPTLDFWDDTRLEPGADWKEGIRTALASANVAVILVSASFLASNFIREEELPQLLASANERGTRVLLLLVSPSPFEDVEGLSRFQTVNPSDKTLSEMTTAEQERTFMRLTKQIAGVLKRVEN